jgi:hypothetical protein
MPRGQWIFVFCLLSVGIIVIAVTLYVAENPSNQTSHQYYDPCHKDACAYAMRAMPLHPDTVGEELDAQRAVDVACRDFRACVKRDEAAAEAAQSGAGVNPNLNPTVREFWRKEAEREAKLKASPSP